MKNTLIVVADLGVFRAYMVEEDELNSTPRLITVEERGTVQADLYRDIAPTVTERRPARAPRNPQFSRTASGGDQHNMELEKRSRLIKHLAHNLERLVGTEQVEHCFFAAPAEIHRQILREVTPEVRKKIEKQLLLDLGKVPKGELFARFLGRERRGTRNQTTAQPASPARKSATKRHYENREIMGVRTTPRRLDRKRGENIPAGLPPAGLVEAFTRSRSSRKDRKLIGRVAARRSVEEPPAKRRRGEPAPIGGFAGKEAAQWSAYRENLSNVKRKPEARHPSAARKALRRGRNGG